MAESDNVETPQEEGRAGEEPRLVRIDVQMLHTLDELALCWRMPGGDQFAITVLRGICHAQRTRNAKDESGRRSFMLLSSLFAVVREQGFDIPF